jgi:hypothetical protein
MVQKLWRWMLRRMWAWLCDTGEPSLMSTRWNGVGWVLRRLLLLFLFVSFLRSLSLLAAHRASPQPSPNAVRLASSAPAF